MLRYTNKVHMLKNDGLEHPVAVIAAGITTYYNKFADRACRGAIEAASKSLKRKLDIVDFCDSVCEPVVSSLLKEYVFDRARFFGGSPVVDYSLGLIMAGITHDHEIRAYHAHQDGLTERIEDYGTVGSGAAYAELFLRYLLSGDATSRTADQAGRAAIYAVKGAELMDPNVSGDTNVIIIRMKDGNKPSFGDLPKRAKPSRPREAMEGVLQSVGRDIGGLVRERRRAKKPVTQQRRSQRRRR